MTLMHRVCVLSLSIFLVGCASASYSPPSSQNLAKNNFIIDKNYDDTYSALVGVLAGTFFAIDNFDKNSGLITLSYSATGSVSKYIECGRWSYSNPMNPVLDFEGKYQDYLVRNFGAELVGRLNIVVKPLGTDKTTLVVNSRYSFFSFTFTGVEESRIRSSNSSTSDPVRVCRPTGYVENLIAEQIRNL
jgi:hypothetical protein